MVRAIEEGKAYDAELTGLAQAEITPALMSMAEESGENEEEEEPAPRSRKSSGAAPERHARH